MKEKTIDGLEQVKTDTAWHTNGSLRRTICSSPMSSVSSDILEKAANAVLIELNWVLLSETIAAIDMALKAGRGTMVSHRSDKAADSFIADFTVAPATGYIKTGASRGGERMEKYKSTHARRGRVGRSNDVYETQGFICRIKSDLLHSGRRSRTGPTLPLTQDAALISFADQV